MEHKLTKLVELSLSKVLEEPIRIITSNGIGGGCINHASKLETNCGIFFLKWNAQGKSDMFLREMEGLQELRKASKGELRVPRTYCAKEIDETPGYLVQEYLIPKNHQVEDDEALGRGLAIMHRYSSPKFGFGKDNYCGATPQKNNLKTNWAEFFGENRLRFLLDLINRGRHLSMQELETYNKLILKIPQLIPRDSEPVLIHGDLWSGNYMITAQGPALIDPAAYYADREMEFAIMTLFASSNLST